MLKIVIAIGLLLQTSCSMLDAQVNYTGSYGYSRAAGPDAPKELRNEGASGELVLLRIENNTYKFWLDLNKGWPSYNMGQATGIITLTNDSAAYDNSYEDGSTPCILSFKLSPAKAKITSTAYSFDCGFGNGVVADGEYPRARKQPVLNNKWLRRQYSDMDTAVIGTGKAVVYGDTACTISRKQYFVAGDVVIIAGETDQAIYTEYISPGGKFVYGWIRRQDLKK